jgi:beta-lactamase superfamily II metal-dependent hydrolase
VPVLAVNDGLLQIFDVEHGGCALLTAPLVGGGVGRLMIDCGQHAQNGWTPGQHLAGLGVTTLDLLAVTNYDEDHVSGFPSFAKHGVDIAWMLRNMSVSPWTITQLKSEDGMGPAIAAYVSSLSGFGDPIPGASSSPQFANITRRAYWNNYPSFDDENNLSMVVVLDIFGFRFLFPGDLECAGWQHLLATNASFREIVGSVNVLIAAHHGRESGICPDIFDTWKCKPRLVVISDDYKQYETQDTSSYYASKCTGITGFRNAFSERKVLSTRKDGEIRFSFAGGNCVVS